MDFDGYKNMVGAFHHPALVYANLSTLKTLTAEQFACGMGEVLKHGLIKNASYYEWCINQMSEIQDREVPVLKLFKCMTYGMTKIQKSPFPFFCRIFFNNCFFDLILTGKIFWLLLVGA